MKRILVTGGTGFLGRHILKGLRARGFTVNSLGRAPGNDIVADLSHDIPGNLVHSDIVVHAAGKAHMTPVTEKEKESFYIVNLQGTRNLLEGLEKTGVPSAFIFISTVAVYGKESGEMITETEPMLATDPYGLSKIQAERIIIEWCERNKVICTIFRLPLIAGPNPPGNLGMMIRGIMKGLYFNIGGGNVRKSIVMADDLAGIILKAADTGGIYHLTDGYHPSFSELSALIAKQLGKKEPKNIPYYVARIMALAGDVLGKKAPINTGKLKKIISPLTFDDTKAVKMLDWQPSKCLQYFRIRENA